MDGAQMKCSVQLESTTATSIRDQANVYVSSDRYTYVHIFVTLIIYVHDFHLCMYTVSDETFDQNFLSPGSLLFLKHLGVIT